MLKLENFEINFMNSDGKEALKTLLDHCGVDAVLKGIQEYCVLYNKSFEDKIFIIDEPYSLLFKDGSLIISKPIK
jgi:hypothetical protein